MDYARNRIYFYPIPEKQPGAKPKKEKCGCATYAILVIGVIVLCFAVEGGAPVAIIGSLMIAVGFWKIVRIVNKNNDAEAKYQKEVEECSEFNNNRRIVTGTEIDEACKEYLESNLKTMAVKKLGIDESQAQEIAPIYISGYDYDGKPPVGKENFIVKNDGSGNRSSIYNAFAFFFSKDQVHCYKLRFSLLEDAKQESDLEYFYGDIVSVATESDSRTYNGVTFSFEKFTLTTSGGTKMGAYVLDVGTIQHSIQKMKSLLRNKKQKS